MDIKREIEMVRNEVRKERASYIDIRDKIDKYACELAEHFVTTGRFPTGYKALLLAHALSVVAYKHDDESMRKCLLDAAFEIIKRMDD